MSMSRREMLAALTALSLVAGAPDGELPEGLELGGLDQELPELAEHDSYEQMVLDYIDTVQRATPEAWFDGSPGMANRLFNPPGGGDPWLWDPFDESHEQPVQVDFANAEDRLFHPEGDQVMGLHWPTQRRIDVDPWWEGRRETERTMTHELARLAVDDFYGYHDDPADPRYWDGAKHRDLRDLAARRAGIPHDNW